MSLQYIKKEFRKGVHFWLADEHQSFYTLGLLFLMEVARYVQSTQNRKLVIFLQRVLQHFCVLLRCKTFRYFTGVQPCLLLLVSSHSQTRNFLPENLIIILKQQLCGEGLPSLLPLLQADVFSIEAVNHLCPSNKPNKSCVRSCDTNNFTQNLTRRYHHTATESLYGLCDENISWAPTLAGLSY